MTAAKERAPKPPVRIGLVTEAMADRPLIEVMDWLVRAAPEVGDLEIGSGGYAPTVHCGLRALLRDRAAQRRWLAEVQARGLRIGALNVWGNPLHPDEDIAARHDADLRDTIRLAVALDVDRVVALAGCPAGAPGDRSPSFAAGGWLPYLEGIHEAQWTVSVEPYWSRLADFAHTERPDLLVCLELHPGTAVYNVETFERLAALGDSIAANIDPSHFFWMGMDAVAVVEHLGPRIGHSHGKDLTTSARGMALNGILDHRWPRPQESMPWNFAVVGRGRREEWWQDFVGAVCGASRANTIAIEHEDPFVPPEVGIPEAGAVLARAMRAASSPAVNA